MTKPPLPEPAVPVWVRVAWRVQEWVTWPLAVRQLKKAGFRRVGWMTWESGPHDPGPR